MSGEAAEEVSEVETKVSNKKELMAPVNKTAAAVAKLKASGSPVTEPPDEDVEVVESSDEDVEKDVKPKSSKKPKKPKAAAKSKAQKAPKVKAPKVAKVKATKVPKAAKARRVTTGLTGQSGPALDLTAEALNKNEVKVLKTFNAYQGGEQISITELSKETFSSKPKAQANSWVRNALRRLVRGELVEKSARGTYKLTRKGRGVAEKL